MSALSTRLEGFVTDLGAKVIAGVRMSVELAQLFAATVVGVAKRDYFKGDIARQMHSAGNKSLLFICVTLGFLGMVMVLQSGNQINRITGDLTQLGPQFLRLFIQEFAPTVTAMMLATRVGAGIAAEVGSMKVTEQIDALRLCGITPTSYLIAPRFVACVSMSYILTVFAVVVAFTAGGITAWSVFDLNPTVFFDSSKVRAYDFILGSSKALCYGMAIPVISAYCGLNAHGGSEGVGGATTKAVIGSSFAVLLIDFLLSGIGFAFFNGGMV